MCGRSRRMARGRGREGWRREETILSPGQGTSDKVVFNCHGDRHNQIVEKYRRTI